MWEINVSDAEELCVIDAAGLTVAVAERPSSALVPVGAHVPLAVRVASDGDRTVLTLGLLVAEGDKDATIEALVLDMVVECVRVGLPNAEGEALVFEKDDDCVGVGLPNAEGVAEAIAVADGESGRDLVRLALTEAYCDAVNDTVADVALLPEVVR